MGHGNVIESAKLLLHYAKVRQAAGRLKFGIDGCTWCFDRGPEVRFEDLGALFAGKSDEDKEVIRSYMLEEGPWFRDELSPDMPSRGVVIPIRVHVKNSEDCVLEQLSVADNDAVEALTRLCDGLGYDVELGWPEGEPDKPDSKPDSRAPGEITPENAKRYMDEAGQHCPFCASVHIEGGRFEADGPEAWSVVRCDTCGKEWRDLYKLIGVEAKL